MATVACDERCPKPLRLLSLPRELLDKILSYLTFDETSSVRLVSKTLDILCRQRLNDGLNHVDRLHMQIHREVKGKLPRRESERRNHVLARHIDILGAIETRLSLLNMTYSKYIEMGLCCFIPGKVLDEMFRILHKIRLMSNPPRAHELLQELRDISSMAMEHFDEKIVPFLKQEPQITSPRFGYAKALSPYAATPTVSKLKSPGSFAKIDSSLDKLRKKLITYRQVVNQQNKKVAELEKKITEQVTVSAEQDQHRVEQDRRIAELEQKIVDYDQKFVDMMVEIARVRSSSGSGDANVVQSTKDGRSEAKTSAADVGSNCCLSVEGKTKNVVEQAEALDANEISCSDRVMTRQPKRKTSKTQQLFSEVLQPNESCFQVGEILAETETRGRVLDGDEKRRVSLKEEASSDPKARRSKRKLNEAKSGDVNSKKQKKLQ